VTASPATLPDLELLDHAALRALIRIKQEELIATHDQLLSHQSEIEHLKRKRTVLATFTVTISSAIIT
jgi:hypothetical protein